MNAPINSFLTKLNHYDASQYTKTVQDLIAATFKKIQELQHLEMFHAIYMHTEFDEKGMKAPEYSLNYLIEHHLGKAFTEKGNLDNLSATEKEKLVLEVAIELRKTYFFLPF